MPSGHILWPLLAFLLDLGTNLDGGLRREATGSGRRSAWRGPPAARRAPRPGRLYPVGLKDLGKFIDISTNGIKLLGGSVGGELEFEITAEAVGLAPARKRADRAILLAARVEQFVTASPTPQAAQQSWFLLSKCCAHALSFDSRLVPTLALSAVEEPVWAAVTRAVGSILTVVPGATAQGRLQLAGCFGGCGLRRETAGAYSDAASYAAWAGNAPRARLLAQALGRPLGGVHGAEHADQVRLHLAAAGVLVSRDGDVTITPDHAARYVASAWQADQPLDRLGALQIGPTATPPPAPADARASLLPRRFVSCIWRHLDATEAAALWHAASRLDRVVMLPAGGAGAGNMWVQLPMRVSDFFDNSHFRASTLLRLADMRLPAGAACQLVARHYGAACAPGEERRAGAHYEAPRRVQEGRVCGQPLGRAAEHALLCKAGPARQRPHKQLAATLAAALRTAGAHVDLERVVPEMMNPSAVDGANRDAILDLVVSFPGSFELRWLDVTIRCPLANRYPMAQSVPGSAASKSAEEKLTRYRPSILPLVLSLSVGSAQRASNP